MVFVSCIMAFVVLRRRSRRRELRTRRQVRHISQISAPNGLAPGSRIPPTYQEALKSPALSAAAFLPDARGHQRQRSDADVLDQCWAAVYDIDEYAHSARAHTPSTAGAPASPQAAVPSSGSRVSRWLRGHHHHHHHARLADAAALSSLHGARDDGPGSPRLPTPPSPSYTGSGIAIAIATATAAPATPSMTASVPQTPMSATSFYPTAPPRSPYHHHHHHPEPTSARSWVSGDTRLSLRASIPASVLYPSRLQPAPPARRLSGHRGGPRDSTYSVDSVDSASEYGSGTWRTITPHEDPPEYEPRRGNPDTVSPV